MILPAPGHRRPALRVLLLLALLGGGARARAAHAQAVPASAQGAEVRAVVFDGAHAFSPAELQAAIETSPPDCPILACPLGLAATRQPLDLETLRADVWRLRLFYYRHGYRQATVEVGTTPEGRGVSVAFRIEEGSPIRVGSLELIGADSVLPHDILQNLELRRGDPFGTLAYEAARDTLTAKLAERGYPHAQVLASYDLPRDTALASVRFEVFPGPLARVGPITVTGTHRISARVVRRMLTFGRGDVYRENQILKSQRNLFGLDVFRRVEIRPDLNAQPDSVVPVTVDVAEGSIHRVRVGAGINTAEALNAEARWTSRDFLGGARRLEIAARISNILAGPLEGLPFMETKSGKYALLNGSLTADFAQPWFFAPMNTFGAGIFAQRQSLPLVYVQSSTGAYFTLNRSLGNGATVSIGYRPELTFLDADDDRIFCVNLTICDQQATQEQDISVLSTPHWLAPLTLSLTRDHSNALFAPSNGSIFRLDGEFASHATASDFSYWRLSAELSEYREVAHGVVLALRVRPGFARSLAEPAAGLGLHPQKRFFAGGPNSVRGFAQGQLGPKVLTVDAVDVLAKPTDKGGAGCTVEQVNDRSCDISGLDPNAFDVHPVGGGALLEGNVEVRFPLGTPRLRGAAFVDYGQLWNTPNDFRLRGLAWTPGLGVRYFSVIGPIRIDVGYDPRGSEMLKVLTTDIGVKAEDGACNAPPADTPTQDLQDCGSLSKLQTMMPWPPRKGFLDHLQLHFSIGQAF